MPALLGRRAVIEVLAAYLIFSAVSVATAAGAYPIGAWLRDRL